MKRILSVLISVLILISIIPLGVNADTSEKVYPELELIKTLGFMSSEISECAYVTREEAVEYMLNLRGITSYAMGQRHFKDVSSYDDFYNKIHSAYSLGIIKGSTDGYFYPEKYVTTMEALIMIMRTMGYSNIIDAAGGNVYDYVMYANQYGFSKGISVAEQPMNAGEFAKLIYNSFSIGIVEAVGFGDSSKYEISRQKSSLSYTGIAMGEGILTDNSYASIHYTVSNFKKGQVIIDGYTYKTGQTDAEEMLGYNVEYFFYDNDEDDIKTLKYIHKKNNTTETISLQNDFYVKKGNLCYLDENNKEQEYEIEANVSFIENGTAKPFDFSYILNAGSTGEIILIDNSNDINGYDLVILNNYKNDIVLGYDEENETINLKYAGNTKLPDKDGVCAFIENEKIVALSDIKSGTSISYLSSDNGLYFKGILCNETISGKITVIETEKRTLFVIDETEIPASKDCKNLLIAELGRNYKFALNFMGEITDIQWLTERNYAYLLKMVERYKDGKSVILTRLYTANGVKEYRVSEKLSLNGTRTDKTVSEIISYVSSNASNDLITYKLNNNDEISDFTFCQTTSGNLLEDSKVFTKYKTVTESVHFNGSIIDKIGANASQVFFIPEGTTVDEDECSVSTLTRDEWYKNLTFYDVGMDGKSTVILVRSGATTGFSGYPSAVVFSKVVNAIDKNGDPCKKMYYYKDGSLNSIIIDENPSCVQISNSKSQYKFDNLAFGDIIAFESNLQGRLDRFAVFFTASEKNVDNAVTYGGGVGQSQANMYISGNLCYYENGVATLDYDGGFQVFNYTDECPLYKIDTQSKVIYTTTTNNLEPKNYYDSTDKGQRVILFGDRYNLKGAFTYE